MKNSMTDIRNVIEILLRTGAVRATKFVSEKQIVRATRKAYKSGTSRDNVEITLTLGRPNYEERAFVKACKKAGEAFPIRKVQLKFSSAKKAAKKRE